MARPAMQLVRPVHSCGSCVLSRSVSVVAMVERSLAEGEYAIKCQPLSKRARKQL